MQIRWGILGCGDVARRRVARAIIDDPNSQLVAACRRNADKLKDFCDDFDVPRALANDQDLIAQDDIDAVYIATPVNLHLPQTIAAARSGKHVLVEKPMAMSVAQCDEMISACRQHGVKLGVAYYRRFYPVVDRMRQIIDSGEIGNVLSVSVVTGSAFQMGPSDDGYWRVIPETGGGGALMDIGSHRLDLMLDLFGDVVDVKSVCSTVAADYDSEDCASLVMRFHSGVHGNLQCYFGTSAEPDEFTVVGTAGRLYSNVLNNGDLTVLRDGNTSTESHPPSSNFNSPLIADFVAAIREDREPMVTGGQGRAVNEVMQRAYQDASN